MRIVLVIVAALALAQCGSSSDRQFRVGESAKAYVIIGVAESAEHREPRYTMLWRRLDREGAFLRYDDDNRIEARTHMRRARRIRGIPGEFLMAEVEPGVYALDSVFALIRDGRVNYSADGVITGPERPAFEVRPGEAVYLGIWQLDINGVTAVARPWRVEEEDLPVVLRHAEDVRGQVRIRRTAMRDVPCTPRQLSANSQRRIC